MARIFKNLLSRHAFHPGELILSAPTRPAAAAQECASASLCRPCVIGNAQPLTLQPFSPLFLALTQQKDLQREERKKHGKLLRQKGGDSKKIRHAIRCGTFAMLPLLPFESLLQILGLHWQPPCGHTAAQWVGTGTRSWVLLPFRPLVFPPLSFRKDPFACGSSEFGVLSADVWCLRSSLLSCPS